MIIVVNNIFYAGRYLEKYHQLCGNFSSYLMYVMKYTFLLVKRKLHFEA
jgi:hypothetical protein